MSRIQLFLVALAVCAVASITSNVHAQSGYRPPARNRSVSRPQLNPYADVLRGGYGGYGSYNSLLAPYMNRNQSTASRRPRTGTTPTNTANTRNPSVDRMRANRAARTSL